MDAGAAGSDAAIRKRQRSGPKLLDRNCLAFSGGLFKPLLRQDADIFILDELSPFLRLRTTLVRCLMQDRISEIADPIFNVQENRFRLNGESATAPANICAMRKNSSGFH